MPAAPDSEPAPDDGPVTVRLLAADEFPRMQRLIEILNPSIPPGVLAARIPRMADYASYRCAAAFVDPQRIGTAPLGASTGAASGALAAGEWEASPLDRTAPTGCCLRGCAASGRRRAPTRGRQLEPDHVVVLPGLRSLGVGRRLMAWVYALARDLGCETVELNAYLANARAHAFYEADGFAKLGYHFQMRLGQMRLGASAEDADSCAVW